MISRLSTQHKVLADAVGNFQTTEDKVTVEADPQAFFLRNYVDDLDISKVIRTQLSLKPVEFDYYSVGIDTHITFSMKEFRAVLTFAEAVNLPITLQFEITGKPAIFTIDNNSTFVVDFVMATESSSSASQPTASVSITPRAARKESSFSVKRSSSHWAEQSAAKRQHLQEEDSQLFQFVDAVEHDQIPASPGGGIQVRRIRTVFQRCFEATLAPSQHAVLALDSDQED